MSSFPTGKSRGESAAASTLRDRMDEGSVNYRATAYALLDENERLRDALDALRSAWNAHMDGCPAQGPTVDPPSEADLAAWRDAPSGTASA